MTGNEAQLLKNSTVNLKNSSVKFTGQTQSAGTLSIGTDSTFETDSLLQTAGVTTANGNLKATKTYTISGADSILKGSGNAQVGVLAIGPDSTLAPGNSPGKLTVTGQVQFNPGSRFQVEIRDASGTSGVDYDRLVVNGDLTNSGSTAKPLVIDLTSLDTANNPGLANFDKTKSYSLMIASVTGVVSGFTSDTYLLDTTHFQNDLSGGSFSLSAVSGEGLVLLFTPVPEPGTLLFIGVGSWGLFQWRRKRSGEKAALAS